ncbi:MAG: YbfB/YjiJ family MFS transporter [Burkholderiaceae bacterium]|nr:YbfB/YjiJ family MFS transporter [Burkholderiaceae bacterium]
MTSAQRTDREALVTALALALGAAVSLGLARFSYAVLLPPMRDDLGWSYFTAGAMNTVNAAGYLGGALLAPALLANVGARTALVGGSVGTTLLLALHGFTASDALLYTLRFLTGVASAAMFVAGGLLAARLGSQLASGSRITPGFVLGLYYGGTGLGIAASALALPPIIALSASHAGRPGWQWGWIGLAILALASTVPIASSTAVLRDAAAARSAHGRFDWRPFGFGMASYFMFGLGYIGYMTFIITLLKEQQMSTGAVIAFYTLLGIGVMASPWLWAGLLQRQRGGKALAILSALLAVATLLPVVSAQAVPAFVSGGLFGAVFLSLVASTTALVRHNLPPAAWPAGISAFTIVFAVGQIVGPSLVGRLADGGGGLRAGLAASAAALALGAALALRQRPLTVRG